VVTTKVSESIVNFDFSNIENGKDNILCKHYSEKYFKFILMLNAFQSIENVDFNTLPVYIENDKIEVMYIIV
jgi:hypothetical protein